MMRGDKQVNYDDYEVIPTIDGECIAIGHSCGAGEAIENPTLMDLLKWARKHDKECTDRDI